MKMRQKVSVAFSYDICFTRGLFDIENQTLAEVMGNKGSKVMAFLDSGVAAAWPGLEHCIGEWFDAHPQCGEMVSPIVSVPGGERCKSDMEYLKVIARNMRIAKLDRHSYVLIIGGGAVLDAVGFIASITHRGIRHIRIPTTVLSQNDSGVGVKNGINLYDAKNYFGTFAPPFAVINDLNFLRTLELRDWIGGMSEAFKVAIIKDSAFLIDLVKVAKRLFSRDEEAMEMLVKRCAQIHAGHIATSGDPFEQGSARPLDFGHWSAHYLEVLTRYSVRHGEAVALGIILDMIIARNRGLVSEDEYKLVYNGLMECGFALWHPALEKKREDGLLFIYDGLEEFRQHLGGELTLIMPSPLGKSCEINSVSYDEVKGAVKEMKDTVMMLAREIHDTNFTILRRQFKEWNMDVREEYIH